MRRRFLDYYRQFDELGPDEVSRRLRAQRDSARSVVEQPPLDLSGAAWHEPPHPEIVNAATFALRRAVNAYPDGAPLRAAIARAHDVDPARVVVGHGAGELLRAALRQLAPRGDVIVAWPGWGPLPRLVDEAGATPVPPPLDSLAPAPGPRDLGAPARPPVFGPRTRVLVLARPNDPTGAVVSLAGVRALADSLPGGVWLILDEALVGFLPPGEDAIVDHPRVVHVRSFSKAHAMAGFRVGYAIVPEGTPTEPLAPVHGVGAAALAGALWAVEHGAASVAARRAQASRERARLAAGPFRVAPGHGPYAWLETGGRPLAEELAAQRVFVAPGTAWGDDAHVRVTLRDAPSTERLLAVLRAL
jgi:histidinol-phosphate aminotransferase